MRMSNGRRCPDRPLRAGGGRVGARRHARPETTSAAVTLVANRFEIERVAGKGGMGTVFRARDRQTDRIVALKVVEPDFANARFQREAELLSELTDSAIVR